MSTHTYIGKLNEDGTVTRIYVHHDGYLTHAGAILHEHYPTETDVDALLALGNLSSLGPRLGEKHDFHHFSMDVCNAYGRDRNEEDAEAELLENEFEFWSESGNVSYAYLFKEGVWHHVTYSSRKPCELTEEILAEATRKRQEWK